MSTVRLEIKELRITAIIPVRNARTMLEACLSSLFSPEAVAPDQCIVVDDGSTDGSADIAHRYGCEVIRRDRCAGPAAARNLGARHATGEILFFLDADVCVHAGTVRRIRETFAADPGLDALIGSYDDAPGQPDFLSQYRNLMHCFVHQTSHREACTFWSGCGAIRRHVFDECGGYDESFIRPSIEDIELGHRLKLAGRCIHLERGIQVKHLKKWTLFGILKTDILDRGIPWTQLILRAGRMPNDLNLRTGQRVSVAAALLLAPIIAVGAWQWGVDIAVPLLTLLMLALCAFMIELAVTARGAVTVILATVLMTILSQISGKPWLVAAVWTLYASHMLLRGLHLERSKWAGLLVRTLLIASAAAGGCMALSALPRHWTSATLVALVALLIALNRRFYAFLAAKKGWLFALSAVPFHLLYHFYSGLAFAAGACLFLWRHIRMEDENLPKVEEGQLDS